MYNAQNVNRFRDFRRMEENHLILLRRMQAPGLFQSTGIKSRDKKMNMLFQSMLLEADLVAFEDDGGIGGQVAPGGPGMPPAEPESMDDEKREAKLQAGMMRAAANTMEGQYHLIKSNPVLLEEGVQRMIRILERRQPLPTTVATPLPSTDYDAWKTFTSVGQACVEQECFMFWAPKKRYTE